LSDKFDVGEVITQVTSALVSSQISELDGFTNATARKAFDETANTASNLAINKLSGGQTDIKALAMNAIGSYIGQEIAGKIIPQEKPAPTQATKKTTPTNGNSSKFFKPKQAAKSQPAKKPVSSHEMMLADDELTDVALMKVDDPEIFNNKIHDTTDKLMGFASDALKGTVAGIAVDTVREIREHARTAVYGSNTTAKGRLMEGGKAFVETGLAIGVPEIKFAGAVGRGVEAVGTQWRKLGLFGGGVESAIQAATKHPLAGLSPENVVRLVDELGLKTPKDQLILWSGLGRGDTGVKLSQEFARTNGGVTLEMTSGGKWLNEMDLFGNNSPFTFKESIQIWEGVSSKMVQQASGQVRSLIGQVRPASIYRSEQSEILMNNKITGLDELYLSPRYIFGRN
jgi:hypothetical protein